MNGKRSFAEAAEDIGVDEQGQPRQLSAQFKYMLVDRMELDGVVLILQKGGLVVHLSTPFFGLTHNSKMR
jgi:hypothetical protein